MPPKIDTFIKCLKDYNFLTVFNKWETYLWSNFPYNYTWDIDIIFIGEIKIIIIIVFIDKSIVNNVVSRHLL